jgi:hypothetical protein
VAQRFPVQQKLSTLLIVIVFFGACAAVLFYMGLTANGVIIEHAIHLGREAGQIFLFVMTGVSLLFVAFALYQLVTHEPRELVLDEDTITVPVKLWRRGFPPKTIKYTDIVRASERRVSGQMFLTIETRTDKVFVTKSMLPENAYAEVTAHVLAKLRR